MCVSLGVDTMRPNEKLISLATLAAGVILLSSLWVTLTGVTLYNNGTPPGPYGKPDPKNTPQSEVVK